ncbi:hypothetical protein OG568_08315 [Streptomyces sp. NBC_01450]|uniref:Rv1733c family protein n=1 Tax=Streptomyces sp. NBC_01450 TaxID=2903871 RepID=UPI002E351713|nr:hypothetical protein [Streptomyces sp. NBC_01450]
MANTCRTRAAKVWLWRWRRNPLRRHSDRLEAWVVLVTWAFALVVGVLAGLATAASVEHGLAEERAGLRAIPAALTEAAAETALTTTSGFRGDDKVWGAVRWTAADGSAHRGRTRVEPGSAAGATVTVWTNDKGRLVAKPATASQVRLRAVFTGVPADLSGGVAVLVCGRLVRVGLDRRRMEQWDVEWERIGPKWRRMTG